jgi:hypothetical protein
VKRRLIDDRTAREYTVEILQDVEARLRAGARGSGVTLTADECQKLLAAGIKPLPRPKGRPPIAEDWWHKLAIAKACLAREDRGESVKSAVIATAKAFGISISAVYAARKIILPSK